MKLSIPGYEIVAQRYVPSPGGAAATLELTIREAGRAALSAADALAGVAAELGAWHGELCTCRDPLRDHGPFGCLRWGCPCRRFTREYDPWL